MSSSWPRWSVAQSGDRASATGATSAADPEDRAATAGSSAPLEREVQQMRDRLAALEREARARGAVNADDTRRQADLSAARARRAALEAKITPEVEIRHTKAYLQQLDENLARERLGRGRDGVFGTKPLPTLRAL